MTQLSMLELEHTKKLRQKLKNKIETVKRNRGRINEETLEAECDHEFQKFKETIHPDNDNFQRTAHFVISACVKCKTKKRTDYKVL